jgi:hypothetical protein
MSVRHDGPSVRSRSRALLNALTAAERPSIKTVMGPHAGVG